MKKNKKVRKELERKYGRVCMFKNANIEKKVEETRVIKTYKRFLQEKRYTGKSIKKLEKMLTLHHLKHRSDGGQTNAENGAIINELAHTYMHSLPRKHEEFINNELRRYKKQYDECKVVYVDDIEVPFEIKFTDFKLEDKKKEKYNRAKTREELIKLSEKYVDR